MTNQENSSKTLMTIVICLIAIFGFPIFVAGQFSVVSTVPQDGASNVDPSITFQINFNEPIDTNILFDYPPGFFINVLVYPDSLTGEPDSISVSPDMKTVDVYNLHLWPDTKYMLLINKAFSAAGQPLTMPYLATFTTGSSLPTATVSGAIFSPSNEAVGTAVILLNAPLFSDENSTTESGTIVQLADGGYTIQYVPPGVYWPAAINNFKINSDGEIEPSVSSELGFYDPDGDGLQDSINVSEDQQLIDINILMFSLAPVTARYNYPAVSDSAENWASDAKLVQLGTQDISQAGKAMMWMYAFYSSSFAVSRAWMTMGTLILPIPLDEPAQDTTALPDNWLDSDVIADSAEANGGSDFWLQHPDAIAQAFLGTMGIPGPEISSFEKAQPVSRSLFARQSKIESLPKLFHRYGVKSSFSRQKKLSFQHSKAGWAFVYFSQSTGDQLFLLFDAVTGKLIREPQPAATTAKFNLAAANQAAQNWSADAALLLVGTHQSNLNPAGLAEMWFFVYYSANFDSEQAFFFSNGNFLGQGPIWEPPSKIALPVNWIDSDGAINSAEAHGGSLYRAANHNVWVNGGVSRGLLQGQPERAVWYFDYNSSTADQLTIYIDAVSGAFIPEPSLNITARGRLPEVNQEKQTWAADAKLIVIGAVQTVAADGTCFAWAYAFYSPAKDSLRVFYAAALGPIGSETPTMQPPSLEVLPDSWIDSDVATAVAEANGGSQFRIDYSDAIVQALLSRNVVPGEPSRAAWKLTYWSASASTLQVFLIDALTGGMITDVDSKPEVAEIPQSYALSQNYPNPFNAETVIEYQLPKASEVEISIFNLQGQKVAALVKCYRQAGIHKIIWNGKDESGRQVASGVYLYQLKIGNHQFNLGSGFLTVRKMLLLR